MSRRRPVITGSCVRLARRAAAVLACALFVGSTRADDPAAKFRIDKNKRIYDGIKDDARLQTERENLDEFLSYNEVVEFANQFSAANLEAHARRDVSYQDLMSRSRADYKLDLIRFEGKLWRVKRFTATAPLEDAGISTLYEGWLYLNGNVDPVCILFSELPEGITPALQLDPPPHVRFAGYSFKVMRYESEDKDNGTSARGKIRRAPLLIGKSVTVVPVPVFIPGSDWQGTFVPVLLSGLGALSAVGIGLAWWFRRGDRTARAKLAQRTQQNPFAGV
ncbi:MAG TPA: hypothetical protein VGJ05_05920 [Fimbriiglobus sp.]|jgi:hypothetical protein